MKIPERFIKKPPRKIAVAVSGGPDSMALLHLAQAVMPRTEIHALTLDHGLRHESAQEAKQIAAWIADWPRVTHHILKWKGNKPESGIMEAARDARYDILCKWCGRNGIRQLWVAHHAGDQAETFLFRLAHGSGVDGLSGMAAVSPYRDSGIDVIRPLLDRTKDEIVAYCTRAKIPFVTDPTNTNMKYARARLRQALPLLEAEGLTEKRLARTATRMRQAREALDFYAARIVKRHAIITQARATVGLRALATAPGDMRIRVIRQVLDQMGAGAYGPRLDRLEDLVGGAFADLSVAKRFTLGGFVFSPDMKRGIFSIVQEKP